jgi:cation transport regulator ChaB
MPSTIKKSPQHAQEIWSEALDSAIDEYGDGERAHRTAYAALKREYEKVGDHWEAKDEPGPSDAGAENRGEETEGGVDANASKEHLEHVARRLDITGRSDMTKDQLVDAIQKENDRRSRHSREED